MRIWLMDGGAAGARAQTSGVAAEIAKLAGGADVVICQTRAGALSAMFPTVAAYLQQLSSGPSKHSQSAQSAPDMIIACGHRSAATALSAKRRHGAFTVFLQKPPVSASRFDAVICPQHDNLEGGNVLPVLGSTGGIRSADLHSRRSGAQSRFANIPDPKTAVLIGGGSRAYEMTAGFCRELAQSVLQAGGGVLATASRRTGDANIRQLSQAFAGEACFFYDGSPGADNPYADILAAADRFVVTADSVNMLSEACAAQRPVWFAEPPLKSARAAVKFRRFHTELQKQDLARRWQGQFAAWTPPGLDETARAAAFIWNQYRVARNIKD